MRMAWANLHTRYVQNVVAVNEAKTVEEHTRLLAFHNGFIEAVRVLADNDGVVGRMLMAGDRHYLDQDIDRPTCGGIWLDWSAMETT